MLLEELLLGLFGSWVWRGGYVLEEVDDALGAGGAGHDRVDGDSCALGELGEAARDGELRGLGDAVVDHLWWRHDAGLGGDEDDAAPVALEHAREVVAREADSAEDVDFEDFEPVGVGDFGEGLGLVDTEVVDEDICVGNLLDEGGCAFGGSWVGDDCFDVDNSG